VEMRQHDALMDEVVVVRAGVMIVGHERHVRLRWNGLAVYAWHNQRERANDGDDECRQTHDASRGKRDRNHWTESKPQHHRAGIGETAAVEGHGETPGSAV